MHCMNLATVRWFVFGKKSIAKRYLAKKTKERGGAGRGIFLQSAVFFRVSDNFTQILFCGIPTVAWGSPKLWLVTLRKLRMSPEAPEGFHFWFSSVLPLLTR